MRNRLGQVYLKDNEEYGIWLTPDFMTGGVMVEAESFEEGKVMEFFIVSKIPQMSIK